MGFLIRNKENYKKTFYSSVQAIIIFFLQKVDLLYIYIFYNKHILIRKTASKIKSKLLLIRAVF